MSIVPDAPEEFALIGYGKLTDHGFALPCFGRSKGANTVYVARASRPGDPTAPIAGFDIYDSERPRLLPRGKRNYRAGVGDPWIDVFLWDGGIYVGTKSEIWASITDIRNDIASNAPLSLLNLAEGVPGVATGDWARIAFAWLARHRSADAASEWRVEIYLRGIAIRDLRRRLGEAAHTARIRRGLQNVELACSDTRLTLRLPTVLTELLRITTTDLDELNNAARGFDLQLIIVRDDPARATDLASQSTRPNIFSVGPLTVRMVISTSHTEARSLPIIDSATAGARVIIEIMNRHTLPIEAELIVKTTNDRILINGSESWRGSVVVQTAVPTTAQNWRSAMRIESPIVRSGSGTTGLEMITCEAVRYRTAGFPNWSAWWSPDSINAIVHVV